MALIASFFWSNLFFLSVDLKDSLVLPSAEVELTMLS